MPCENGRDGHDPPIGGIKATELEPAQGHSNLPQPCGSLGFVDRNDYQGEGKERGDHCNPEHRYEVIAGQPHQENRQQRAGKCPNGIERLAKSEARSPNVVRANVRNERVSWCTTYSLADSIDEPRGNEPAHRRGQRKDRFRERSKAIAERRQELALAQPIAERARKDF